MQDNKARYRENQFNIGREERAQIRESQRGSNPARGYSPIRTKKPNRFTQGIKDFGNDIRQLGVDTNRVIVDNPVTNTIRQGVDYTRDKIAPGVWGAGIEGLKNMTRNNAMHGQNKDYFDGNWLHDKIPDNVRESLMTKKDKLFYDKYMKLARLGGDRKQEYLNIANQAKRNAQITGRLNYGLGQVDQEGEYLNSEGLPSYFDDNFNNEGESRFNRDAFIDAMGIESLDEDITSQFDEDITSQFDEDITSQFDVERARKEGRAGLFPSSPLDFSSDVGGENGNFLMEENAPFDQQSGLSAGEFNDEDKTALEATLGSEAFANANHNKQLELLEQYGINKGDIIPDWFGEDLIKKDTAQKFGQSNPADFTTKDALKDIAKLYYENGSDIDKFFFDMFGFQPDPSYIQEGWEEWINPKPE